MVLLVNTVLCCCFLRSLAELYTVRCKWWRANEKKMLLVVYYIDIYLFFCYCHSAAAMISMAIFSFPSSSFCVALRSYFTVYTPYNLIEYVRTKNNTTTISNLSTCYCFLFSSSTDSYLSITNERWWAVHSFF